MTRKQFLLASAAASATPVWGVPRTRMGIATTSYMTAWRPKDTYEFLEHCQALGAGGIQAGLASADPTYLKKLRSRAEQAGLKPHSVPEKYYFARGPQWVNRVVDIAPTLEIKKAAIRSCRTMIAHMVKDLNASLADRKLRLPALAGGDDNAIREYTDLVFQNHDAAVGRKHGLQYAEEFHYIGPDNTLEPYITRNAVRI